MRTCGVILGLLLAMANHALVAGFVPPSVTNRAQTVFSRPSLPTPPTEASNRRTPSSRLFMSTKAAATKSNGRKRLAACMGFITGWANLAIFTKFKTFATMLTGNTMWLALSVTEGKFWDAAYYISVIGSYLLGTALFRRIDLSLRKKTLPVCAAAVASLFILGDWIRFTTLTRWIPMMIFATGFGIVNSLGMEVSGTLTFVVTGHMTKLTNQLVDRLSRTAGRRKLTEAEKTAVVQNSSMFGGFFAGALFGSFLVKFNLLNRFGNFSAIGISYALLWLFHDMEALGGAWWLRKNGELCDVDDDGEFCDIEEVKPVHTSTNGSVSTDDELKP